MHKSILELGPGITVGTGTFFTYDAHNRLIREVRDAPGIYDYAYTYDAGGNRLSKTLRTNSIPQVRTTYHYDVESPSTYGSKNNRLMYSETQDLTVFGEPLLSTTWYTYTGAGNVDRVITRNVADCGSQQQNMMGGGGEGEMSASGTSEGAGESSVAEVIDPGEGEGGGSQAAFGGGGGNCVDSCKYSAIRFGYAYNTKAVTHVVGESWCWNDSQGGCPGNYKVDWGREFRYDGARARYMNRKLSTIDLNVEANPDPPTNGSTVWTEYDGDEAYSELISKGTAGYTEPGSNYQPGQWRRLKNAVGSGFTVGYLHNDLLGTLRQTTGTSGASSGGDVFTAFGERVNGSADRFGYVGAHGYQSTLDSGAEVFPFLHLGHRYYDPSSGRFLQRDPIGIRGGANVYSYVAASPAIWTDPDGLQGKLGDVKSGEAGFRLACIACWSLGIDTCSGEKDYPGKEELARRWRARHPLPAPPWHPPMELPPPTMGPPAPPKAA